MAVFRANQPPQAARIVGLLVLIALCMAALPALDSIRLQTSVDSQIPDPIVGRVSIAGAIVAGFSSLFGDIGTSVIVGLIIGWLFGVGRQRDAVVSGAAFVIAEVLSRVTKLWFDAPRPFVFGDEGFQVASVPDVYVVALIAALALVAVVSARWRRPAFFAALGVALLFGTTVVVDRIVPTQLGIDGFPSGHAVGSMAAALIATIAAWRTRIRWPVVLIGVVVVLGVAASRLYLDAHYPADVLGGWCVAIASVDLAWLGGTLASRVEQGDRQLAPSAE